jgi:hypothetical protein
MSSMFVRRIAVLCPIGRDRQKKKFIERFNRLSSIGNVRDCLIVGVSEVARARTMLSAAMLTRCSEFDYVIMVDDDIEFTTRDVEKLLLAIDSKIDKVHLGWYRVRALDDSDDRVSVLKTDGGYWRGGLGFCGMSAQLFKELHQEIGDDWICIDPRFPMVRPMYASGPSGHNWLSEDMFFCDRAKPELAESCVVMHDGKLPSPFATMLDGSPLTDRMKQSVQ